MSPISRSFRNVLLLALLILTISVSALPAAAQVKGSIPVSGGPGTINYIVQASNPTCFNINHHQTVYTLWDFDYYDFSYVDGQGNITPFPSYVRFFVQNAYGPYGGHTTCPQRQVTGTGDTLFLGGYGSAYAIAVPLATSSSTGFTATYYAGTSGYVNPKYMVVGVLYAPPGSLSSVSYANSTLTSSTTTLMASLTKSVTDTSSIQAGGVFGYLDGSEKITQSETVTQLNKGTTAVTATYTKSQQLSVDGPGPGATGNYAGDYEGVDHDLDLIEVWVNPVLLFSEFTINGQKGFVWYGYGYSELDSAAPVEVVEVQAGCLNGDYATDSGCISNLQLLQRSWAATESWPTGQGPELTQTDLDNILKADPFGQCRWTSAIGSSACPVPATGYVLLPPQYTVTSYSFQYTQCTPTEQPAPKTFVDSMTNSTTQTQQGTTTVAQTYGYESTFKGTQWLSDFQSTEGSSQTLTYVYQQNTQITSSSTSTVTANIQQPGPACVGNPCSRTYPPSSQTYGTAIFFDIYQDNYFGTFLFVPTVY